MKRSFIASIALSLAIVASVVPAVLAADPVVVESPAPSAPAPAATPIPTDGATPPDGEISVDPTFITAAPSGAVLGATGRPDVTPPPTDAITTPATSGGATLQALLVVLAAVSILVLLAGRLPDARRR